MSVQSKMTAIANAIRSLKGISSTLTLDGMASALSGITKKAATTYTPTTSDQIIAAGQYLSGVQTIKGDANLAAGNIKSGVSIFGISGTHAGQKAEQSKTVTPTANGFTVSPDSGKVLSSVVVNGDSDLKASNVRKNVNIFGTVGTLEEGITPTGTKSITANGTYDVTNDASAEVNVPTGALNAKRFSVTFASDQTSSINVVSGDSDIAAHYLDSTFGIMFHRREDNSMSPAGSAAYMFSGFIQNTLLYTGAYGIFMGRTSSAISRQSVGGNVNSLATSGGFYIRANGVVYAMCSVSRVLPAGTYDIIVFW